MGYRMVGMPVDQTMIVAMALIVAGIRVGTSGSILTKQMADQMNRLLGNVFCGGIGAPGGAPGLADPGPGGPVSPGPGSCGGPRCLRSRPASPRDAPPRSAAR